MAVHSADGGPRRHGDKQGRWLRSRPGSLPVFSATSGPSVGLVAALSAVAIGVAAVVSPDQVEHGPVLCPFRLATGLPCPGCGLTRSWVLTLHGRGGDALAANPFGILALAAAVALVVVVGVRVGRGAALPTYADLRGEGRRRRLLTAAVRGVAVAWIGFAVVRLLVVLAA